MKFLEIVSLKYLNYRKFHHFYIKKEKNLNHQIHFIKYFEIIFIAKLKFNLVQSFEQTRY